jgi:hypothetical protein
MSGRPSITVSRPALAGRAGQLAAAHSQREVLAVNQATVTGLVQQAREVLEKPPIAASSTWPTSSPTPRPRGLPWVPGGRRSGCCWKRRAAAMLRRVEETFDGHRVRIREH